MTIAAWERELGMRPNTLRCRLLRYGWSVEKSMTTPIVRYAAKRLEAEGDLPGGFFQFRTRKGEGGKSGDVTLT